MGEKYLGSYVSVDCGELYGCYQGKVVQVDTVNQRLVLEDAWKDGTPCPGDVPVILLASSIQQLSLIPSPREDRLRPKAPTSDTLRTISPRVSHRAKVSSQIQESPRKAGASSVGPPDTPSKDRYGKGRVNRDDACFEADFNADNDFDFETNLALFDKKAVLGEIGSGKQQQPPAAAGGGGGGGGRTVSNFRHDENVLETAPPMYRQIHLPCHSTKEFLTDSGLVVPSATAELRGLLLETMDKWGIGIERRSESIARAVADVALHFLGGPHRLTPKNSHQKPVVALLCGSHPEASGTVCAARHLANLGVRTVVFLTQPTAPQYLIKEIELYKLTGQLVINNEKKLPADPDLIIAALLPPNYSGNGDPRSNSIVEWANRQRAPTMSIDNPPASLITKTPWLDIKATMAADLPLAYGNGDGKLYLYSLSTPKSVFEAVQVEYSSPFGSKFIITLHESS